MRAENLHLCVGDGEFSRDVVGVGSLLGQLNKEVSVLLQLVSRPVLDTLLL